jgi:diguanylate cyclase (GGDEF)-like protein
MSQKTNIHVTSRTLAVGLFLSLCTFQLTTARSFFQIDPFWIEMSCILYLLVILLASIGFGFLGILYGLIPSLILTSLVFIRTSHNPLWIMGTFTVLSFAIFIYMTYHQKQKVKKEIVFLDFESRWNDFSKEYSKHKSILRSYKNKIDRYSTLRQLGEKLTSTLSLEETGKKTLELSQQLVGKGDHYSLYLLDETLKYFKLTHQLCLTSDGENLSQNTSDPFNNWIMKHRHNLLIEELQSDFRFEETTRESVIASMIATPLITEDKLIGTLRIESRKPFTFQLEDLRLLSALASIASTSLKNARLYSETLELSIKDGLTGLYMPIYFHQELEKAFENTKRNHQPLSVFISDIDDFKKINDQYGHTVGDVILKKIGEVFRHIIEPCYVPTRYGGEEFSAIFPNWNLEKTHKIAETLVKSIAQIPFEVRREKFRVTLSLGICQNDPVQMTKDDLLHRADQALYEAKRSGKNKICIAPPGQK